jgi:hypothetical protein
MSKFRKKPVEVEAWTVAHLKECARASWDALPESVREAFDTGVLVDTCGMGLSVHTLEGVMHADPSDWIIRGVEGEFYPCKAHIFGATYDLVL